MFSGTHELSLFRSFKLVGCIAAINISSLWDLRTKTSKSEFHFLRVL
jgi:hypothetical protein